MNNSNPSPTTIRLKTLDLLGIWFCLALLTIVAWWYLLDMARAMSAMPANNHMHPGMKMLSSADGHQSHTSFGQLFLMWAIMMIAMMVPTAARTVMVFARIHRAESTSAVIPPSYLFITGYLSVWTGFSAGAALLQLQLEQMALVSPMMVATSPTLTALLLVSAGIYQLLPAKKACLRHCQSPYIYISRHFRPGLKGAYLMGFTHGLYCLGCCWAIMLLLFVTGVMNLLWVLLITLFVLVEKLLGLLWPVSGRWLSPASGVMMLAAGIITFTL